MVTRWLLDIIRKTQALTLTREMARKDSGKYAGKSLIGRIGKVNGAGVNRKRAIPGPTPTGPKKAGSAGFTVVNGKLVKADDIGVLLRAAGNSPRDVVKGKREVKKSIRSAKANSVKVPTKPKQSTSKAQKKMKSKPNVITPTNIPTFPVGTGNTLVISTNTDASDKSLVLYNLTLGVNQRNLQKILENLANVSIKRVKVRDLPSGSATAHVWLKKATIEELERVRKLFHGALVDGRTIQVMISSETSNNLTY